MEHLMAGLSPVLSFLLRSMRGDLSLKQALERCRREIEPFFLLRENQPVYEVRR